MTSFSNTFGLAMRNFTTYPEIPDPQALIAYAVKAEELGFDSVWVWDHIFLGVDPPFPVLDSLTLLGAVAARTARIKLGTGVLVLPLRNPVVLAKELSSLDLIHLIPVGYEDQLLDADGQLRLQLCHALVHRAEDGRVLRRVAPGGVVPLLAEPFHHRPLDGRA